MPSILIITYYFPPWGMGGVQRALKFAKYLPEFGCDVTVIAPQAGQYVALDSSLLDDLPQSVRVERVDYEDRAIGPFGPFRPLARTVSRWRDFPDRHRRFATLAVKRARALMREKTFDLLLTSSPPPSVHRAGLELSRDIPWIADFRDPWQAIDNDYGPSPLHRLVNCNMHRAILRSAEAVLTTTPELANRFKALGPSLHIESIRNGFDEMDFTWPSPPPWTGDKLSICLPGTFSRFSDPLPAFRAISAWRSKNPDLPLHILHVGATMGIDVDKRLRACGLLDVYEDVGYVNHARAVAEISFADLLMLVYDDPEVCAVSVPGRIYEMLRSQRPIVAFTPFDSALDALLRPQVGCVVVPTGNSSEESDAIERVMRLPLRPIDDVRQFERRTQTARLAALCRDIIGDA